MDYKCKFIDGITIDEIDQEIDEMYEEEYKYSRCIDRPRMWDLLHTKEILIREAGN